MEKKEDQIKLQFVSDLKFTEFCVLVLGFLRNLLSIGEDDYFKIEISLREVLNNAILHGNKCDTNKDVQVTFSWSRTSVHIWVKDENCDPVDLDRIQKEVEERGVLATSGRGIMIVQNYMDNFELIPRKDGTEIIIEKNL
jgi:serine/threonine-protein kinase RsbW